MAEDPIKHVDAFIIWKKELEKFLEKDDKPYNNLCEYSPTGYPDNYEAYKKICLYFAKSIKYIVSDKYISQNNNNLKEICSYLNYWLNSELRKVKKPQMYTNVYYSNLNKHSSSGKFHIKKCHEHIKEMEDSDFEDLQYLYNLFLNINLYQTSYPMYRTWDCDAANECYKSYNERVSDCEKQDNTSFCEKLKEFHSTYNDTMRYQMCQGVPTSLGTFGQKSEPGALSKESEPGDNRKGSHTTLQESPHDNDIKTLISNAQTPFISSVGVISTFFTPIGTHMRQLFKRNKTEFTNMDKENNAYSILNSDYEQKNSETDTYNITYDQH
ncbi:PIR protein [Plasmodium vivax]|nr:PIR protein [Plasmodium vivax]